MLYPVNYGSLFFYYVLFDPRPAGILASLVAFGRFASSASDPNGALGRGLLYPFNYGSLLFYYILLLCFIRSPHGGNTRFARGVRTLRVLG